MTSDCHLLGYNEALSWWKSRCTDWLLNEIGTTPEQVAIDYCLLAARVKYLADVQHKGPAGFIEAGIPSDAIEAMLELGGAAPPLPNALKVRLLQGMRKVIESKKSLRPHIM